MMKTLSDMLHRLTCTTKKETVSNIIDGGVSQNVKSDNENNQLGNDTANKRGVDYEKYRRFRDELLSFSLGESAFDYSQRLFQKTPNRPQVMALLAQTAAIYDVKKNKVFRDHWCDRLDLLQRGVDVSRKCIKQYPQYGPCYRSYVMCATRQSEALYYVRRLEGIGLIQNYHAIIKRGTQGMKLMPKDAEIPNALAALSARCVYKWYEPTRWYALYYGVPNAKTLLRNSIQFSKQACANNPHNLQYACRLAQAYFHQGNFDSARRWYIKVRDEMPPQDISDEYWQSLAHTELSTAFTKVKWNVPFA